MGQAEADRHMPWTAFVQTVVQASPTKPYQSGPYTPIMGPNGRKLLFRPKTGE
jgi:hypothetical protein